MAGNIRRHPIYQLIEHSGNHGRGAMPTAAELDKLKVPADIRRKVEWACATVADLKDEGSHQAAWERAAQDARTIIGALPDELQNPDHWAEPDPLAEASPDELAAAIGRR